jgi:polyferredoxin
VPGRFDLLSVPVVGPFLRAQSGRRFLQALMFISAIAVIVDGIFGPQVSSANLAGVLPWTYWRVFVVIALLVAGNFFCMACPFTLFREIAASRSASTPLAASVAFKMVGHRSPGVVFLEL